MDFSIEQLPEGFELELETIELEPMDQIEIEPIEDVEVEPFGIEPVEQEHPVEELTTPSTGIPEGDIEEEPTSSEIWKAAFKQDNWVASSYNYLDDEYEESKFTPVEGYDISADLKERYPDLSDLDYFNDSDSPEETDYQIQQYNKELEDKRILADGGWEAVAAQTVAVLADPIALAVAVGGLFGSGGSATVATGAVKLARLRKIGTTALALLAENTATESVLYATQDTRTTEQAATNIVTGVAGGVVIGELAGVAVKGGKKLWNAKQEKQASKQLQRTLEYIQNPTEANELAAKRAVQVFSLNQSPSVKLRGSDDSEVRDISARLLEDTLVTKQDIHSDVPTYTRHSTESIINFRNDLDNAKFGATFKEASNAYVAGAKKNGVITKDAKIAFNKEVADTFYKRIGGKEVAADESVLKVVDAMVARNDAYKADMAVVRASDEIAKLEASIKKLEAKRDVDPDLVTNTKQSILELKAQKGKAWDDLVEQRAPVKLRPDADMSKLDLRLRASIKKVLLEEESKLFEAEELADEVIELINARNGLDFDVVEANLSGRLMNKMRNDAYGTDDVIYNKVMKDLMDGGDVSEFMEDPSILMASYGEYAVSRGELAREFGDYEGIRTANSIREKAKVRAKQDPANAKDIIKKAEKEAELIEVSFSRVNKTFASRNYVGNLKKDGKAREWLRGSRALTTAAMMGDVVASSMADVVMPMVRHGLFEALGATGKVAFYKAARRFGHQAAKMNKESLQDMAVAIERQNQNNVKKLLQDSSLMEQSTNRVPYLSDTADTISAWFGKASGMNFWVDTVQEIAGTASVSRLSKLAKKHTNGKRISKTDRIWLNQLRLTDSDLAGITTQTAGKKIDTRQWNDFVLADKVRMSIQKDVNNTIIKPSDGDTHAFVATDVGKSLFQFRTFSMGASNRIAGNAAQRLSSGDARVVAGVFGGMVTLTVASLMRDTIRHELKQMGLPDHEKKPYVDSEDDFTRAVVSATTSTGYLGGLSEIASVTGFVNPYSKSAQEALYGTPSLSYARNVMDFGKGIGTTAVSTITDDNWEEELGKTIGKGRKLLPLQSAFYVKSVLDLAAQVAN